MSGVVREKNIIVVDLDGTLALDEHRVHHIRKEPRDWDAYFAECAKDAPNAAIIALVQVMHKTGYEIRILSGRRDDCFVKTVEWLAEHDVPCDLLQMRQMDDRTDDHKLKLSWVQDYKEKILFVLEDRDRVVNMWRRNGLTCLQVAPGNF
jgi:hypothetical protein